MAWEENLRICLHMQLIAILSRTEVSIVSFERPQPVAIMRTKINHLGQKTKY